MTDTPDRSSDARRREYEARVFMGEPPARAVSSIPFRDRDTPRHRRRLAHQFLIRYCFGFGTRWSS